MALETGTKLGPYEVVAPLGRGGMGEVYRARDARLSRDVAVKVLPVELRDSHERFLRFEREARAAGALNHANIVAVHDVGETDGIAYLVCELLEGETVRDRLLRGPLPPARAVEIAAQVARGLGAAHEKGIVHRDLKPENLFLTAEGQAKVLDFGLATRFEADDAREGGGSSNEALTSSGMVVGTAGYMAPEQVRGEAVDGRTDVFALGACLYEMLSGKRAFRGGSAVEAMSAVVRDEPPSLSSIRPGVSPQLERIVRRCLEKGRTARFQSARDLAFALESLSPATLATAQGTFPRLSLRGLGPALRRAGVPLAALVAGAVAGGLVVAAWRRPAPLPPSVLRPLTHSGKDASPAASPDGQLVAFVSQREGGSRIWLKQLRGDGERALTEGPADSEPRFFPDGQSILFARVDEEEGPSLWRVPIVGGEPRKLVEGGESGDVSPDGTTIAFLRPIGPGGRSSSLVLVPVSGGTERELARIDAIVYHPRFSPDGRVVALSEEGSVQSATPGATLLVALDGRVRRLPIAEMARKSTSVAWVGTGKSFLVGLPDSSIPHARAAGLHVNEVDARTGAATPVGWWPAAGRTIDVLADGQVVFDSVSMRETLYEVDLEGAGSTRRLTNGMATDRQPVYSPDGKWILFSSDRSGQLDLWMLSRETGALRRLTDDPSQDWDPAFSPDGSRVVWSTNRSGRFEIWTVEVDGTGARPLTTAGMDAENPALSPDGTTLLYGSLQRGWEGIWRVKADGGQPAPLVRGAWLQIPEISPDGRYVLFRDGRGAGRRAVRVVQLADGAEVFAIVLDVADAEAGVETGRARWMPDGRGIAFVGLDERGVSGVFVQDFAPGKDTTATRRPLAGFDPGAPAESFGVAPDGTSVTIAARERLASLVVADPVPGASRPARR